MWVELAGLAVALIILRYLLKFLGWLIGLAVFVALGAAALSYFGFLNFETKDLWQWF